MRKARWIVLAALLPLALQAPPAGAQERIGFGYSHLRDGNCDVAQRTMVGDYSRASDALVLRGRVRTEPAGGDCRLDAFGYDVRIARYFQLGPVDATVEFAASEQTTAAPYVLTDDAGAVLLRSDGNALYGANLPAGSSQTVVAAVGASKSIGGMRLAVLVNLAPIDWAEHPAGRTVRLAWDAGWRGFYTGAAADVGAGHFGAASAGYRHALAGSGFDVGVDVTRRWGLAAVDNGAPLAQLVAGSSFLRDGPPQDHSTTVEVTLGYRLGG